MALTALTKHDQEYCKKLSGTVCRGRKKARQPGGLFTPLGCQPRVKSNVGVAMALLDPSFCKLLRRPVLNMCTAHSPGRRMAVSFFFRCSPYFAQSIWWHFARHARPQSSVFPVCSPAVGLYFMLGTGNGKDLNYPRPVEPTRSRIRSSARRRRCFMIGCRGR